jgi:hypothetical protein
MTAHLFLVISAALVLLLLIAGIFYCVELDRIKIGDRKWRRDE